MGRWAGDREAPVRWTRSRLKICETRLGRYPGVTLGRATEQETTVPKSRVRTKAVYTPPPKRSASKKVSPRWLVPAMLACLLIGLAWIAVFYVTQGTLRSGPWPTGTWWSA